MADKICTLLAPILFLNLAGRAKNVLKSNHLILKLFFWVAFFMQKTYFMLGTKKTENDEKIYNYSIVCII